MLVGNKFRLVTAGAGTNQLAGPNPRRVGLLISSPSTGQMDLVLGGDAATTDGIRFNSGVAPMLILFDKPNDWITLPVSVWSSAAQAINMVEFVDRLP